MQIGSKILSHFLFGTFHLHTLQLFKTAVHHWGNYTNLTSAIRTLVILEGKRHGLRDGCLFRPQTCGGHNFALAVHLLKLEGISEALLMGSRYLLSMAFQK